MDGRPIQAFISRKGDEDGRGWEPGRLDPALLAAISEPSATVLSTVGGNSHHTMALLASDRPFDFILSEAPSLPLDETVEYIPEKQLRDSLRRRVISHTALLVAMAKAGRASIFHSESPPPSPDDDQFRRDLAARTPKPAASPWLRLKMWRLHSAVVRHICEDSGVTFLAHPPAAVDAHGFLLPAYFHNATHANTAYARMVWRDLDGRL